jgi:hypothetical protein
MVCGLGESNKKKAKCERNVGMRQMPRRALYIKSWFAYVVLLLAAESFVVDVAGSAFRSAPSLFSGVMNICSGTSVNEDPTNTMDHIIFYYNMHAMNLQIPLVS